MTKLQLHEEWNAAEIFTTEYMYAYTIFFYY